MNVILFILLYDIIYLNKLSTREKIQYLTKLNK